MTLHPQAIRSFSLVLITLSILSAVISIFLSMASSHRESEALQFPVVEEQQILEELTLTELLDKLNDIARSRKALIKYSAALDHQNHNILQAIKSKSNVLEAATNKAQQCENVAKEACRLLRSKRTIIDQLNRRDGEEVWLSQVYCLWYRNSRD